MKNRRLFWLLVLLAGLTALGIVTQTASAKDRDQFQAGSQSMSNRQAAQTPIPTISTSFRVTETPESRVLPAVGGNAGLVLAASVLVLIILGGVVLSSRRKLKH